MKVTKISMTLATAGLLALTPALFAQTNTPSTNAPAGRARGGRMTVEQQMENLDKALKLTDAQKPKVKELLEEQSKKIQAIPAEDRRAKMPEIRDETNKKMEAILTPEQFTEYKKIQQQRGGRNRNGGGGGGAGGGGQ
jgi:Spy/CpxP family protein refolding chaperone